jgi:hypothetical protein
MLFDGSPLVNLNLTEPITKLIEAVVSRPYPWATSVRAGRVSALCVIAVLIGMQGSGAEKSKPSIETWCSNDYKQLIVDNPEEEYRLSTSLHVNWLAKNSTEVWVVSESESQRQPPSGATRSGAPVVLIAVGPGGIAQTVMGCSVKTTPSGRKSHGASGLNGLIYTYNDRFDLERLQSHSFVQRISASPYSIDKLGERLRSILQEWQLTMQEGPRPATLGSDALASKIFYTPEYIPRPELCDPACQHLKIHKEVAFVVMLKALSQTGKTWDYEVRVLPTVMMRYEMEGGAFYLDPDGTQVALPVCKKLVGMLK